MKTTVDKMARGAAVVPVTSLEEAPALSQSERADIIAALEVAAARIAAGDYGEHDTDGFIDRLMEVRATAIDNRKA